MTVWYSHDVWAWVVSVLFMANIHSRVYGEDAHLFKFQNDSVWTPNGNLRSSQNDSVSCRAGQGGGDGVCMCVVNQA